jgi:hypothetical protein
VERVSSDLIRVRGVTSDNYDVKHVLVNNRPVHAIRENHQDWEIDLPALRTGGVKLTAFAEDQPGNTEAMPHVVDYFPRKPTPAMTYSKLWERQRDWDGRDADRASAPAPS